VRWATRIEKDEQGDAGEDEQRGAEEAQCRLDRLGALVGDLLARDHLDPAGHRAGDAIPEIEGGDTLGGLGVDGVVAPDLAEDPLRSADVEGGERGAGQVVGRAEPGGAHDGELLRRALEENLDLVAESELVLLGRQHVDDDLARPLGLPSRPEAQGGQVGCGCPVETEGGGPGGGDRLPCLVDQLGVAADRPLGRLHPWDPSHRVEHRRGHRVADRIGSCVDPEAGRSPDRNVGAGRNLREQRVEGAVDRVG